MKEDIVAVILAGGIGSRFWPFSCDKVVFPFFGSPFASYSISRLLPKQITRAVVITNSINNTILSKLTLSVPVTTVIQRSPLGMADAILSASSELSDSRLFIMNADDLTKPGYFNHVIEKGMKRCVFGVIPAVKTKVHLPFGYLETDGRNIQGIIEKPEDGNEPSPYAVLLGHFIADSNILLDELLRTRSSIDDIYEKALSTLMQRYTFLIHEYEGDYATLKYPWHVLDVTRMLLSTLKSYKGTNVEVGANTLLEGKIWIGDNVRIMENSKIIGPSYIGSGTIIGNNSLIRASYIGDQCVTGFNSDITRSYIGNCCWLHNNYIGDSVLEEQVSMGSGAVLANLRFDDQIIYSTVKGTRMSTGRNKLGSFLGKGVRIGVNSSIMPGIKIGKGSFIGSGMVIDKDIPEESYCEIKQSYTVSRNRLKPGDMKREEFRKAI